MVQFLTQPSQGPSALSALRQLTLQAKEAARNRAFQARLLEDQQEHAEYMYDKQLAAQRADWERGTQYDIAKTKYLEKGRAKTAELGRGLERELVETRGKQSLAAIGAREQGALARGQLETLTKFGGGVRKLASDVADMFSPESLAGAEADRALTGLRRAQTTKALRETPTDDSLRRRREALTRETERKVGEKELERMLGAAQREEATVQADWKALGDDPPKELVPKFKERTLALRARIKVIERGWQPKVEFLRGFVDVVPGENEALLREALADSLVERKRAIARLKQKTGFDWTLEEYETAIRALLYEYGVVGG